MAAVRILGVEGVQVHGIAGSAHADQERAQPQAQHVGRDAGAEDEAVGRGGAGRIEDRVVTVAQVEDIGVVTRAAREHVVARATGEHVIEIAAGERVVTRAALQRVGISSQPLERIAAGTGVEREPRLDQLRGAQARAVGEPHREPLRVALRIPVLHA